MRNEKLRQKKIAKQQAGRKDYVRRRNMNNNVPTDLTVEKVEKYKYLGLRSDGTAELAHVGYRMVNKKRPHYQHHTKDKPWEPQRDEVGRNIGIIAYPRSRKFTESKKLSAAN